MPRAALLDRLHASPDVPILAVAAPPGYGKTTLLRQWAEEAPHRVAWLSMGPEDNDPAVLLASLTAALDLAQPIDLDASRGRAPRGLTVATVVARRVAAIVWSMGPVALVLDQTEQLHNRQCRDAIAELALRLPPVARLVVATRGRPPIPMAKLRAAGAVLEIGARDLAMDEREARHLLEVAGLGLHDDQLVRLVEHTEGWPVGLSLAALALNGEGRHQSAARSFSGDRGLMAEYLRTEVLAHLSRGRLHFLIRTSVLDRMSGPLCDAVLGTSGSAQLLRALESSDLVIPLDSHGEWYRCNRLFRELLRAELVEREGKVVRQLHAHAAAWCEGNGLPDAAIEHAQAAGDADRAARLVASRTLSGQVGNRLQTASGWFRWFDARGLVERYPPVAVLGAALMALVGQPVFADRWATIAESVSPTAAMPDGSPIEIWQALLRMLLCRNGLAQMRRDAVLARVALAPQSPWRAQAVVLEGVSWLLEGEPDRADPVLARAEVLGTEARAAGLVATAKAERALVAIDRGDWREAARLAEHALGIVRAARLEDDGSSAIVHAVVARTSARSGDLARARDSLVRAARLRPRLTHAMPLLAVQTLLELGTAYLALADTAGARAVLRDADHILRLRPNLGILPRQADELRSTLDSLRVGAVGASSLTTAELRLVPLLGTHLSFREIGERLHVSRHTVKTQAISVYRKLGVTSRSEAMERVHVIGLLEQGGPAEPAFHPVGAM